jgi:tetratricopeptide (TPR) repeat protein
MTNKDPSQGKPKRPTRSSFRTTRTLAAVLVAGLLAPPIVAEADGPDWAKITRKAPEGLLKVAQTKRPALFFIAQPTPALMSSDIGFFLDEKGLALCPLPPLCRKGATTFHLGNEDRTKLKTPVVLAVFPKVELALIKFDRKPKSAASLSISKEATSVGTWVALLSLEVDPDPVLGPILSYRTTSIDWEMKSPDSPAKQFSFATGRAPRQNERVFVKGAPLLNLRGEVVAVFQGSQPLQIQTLRLATPTTGLPERIAGAVKKDGRLNFPLRAEHHGLDPAEFSDEYDALQGVLMARDQDPAKARISAKALLKKYPESFLARKHEFQVARMGLQSEAVSPKELIELVKGLEPPGKAHPAEQAIYLNSLGEALFATGQIEKAIATLKQSDELHPAGMACGTLAGIFQRKGQLQEAEAYYRRAAALTPERMGYWYEILTVLTGRGKSKEISEIYDRTSLLEDLYSGP